MAAGIESGDGRLAAPPAVGVVTRDPSGGASFGAELDATLDGSRVLRWVNVSNDPTFKP
jgi:hypothetical protein